MTILALLGLTVFASCVIDMRPLKEIEIRRGLTVVIPTPLGFILRFAPPFIGVMSAYYVGQASVLP